MTNIKVINQLLLGKRITLYLSILLLVAFFFSAIFGEKNLTLLFLYLIFIFWGSNKAFAYYLGDEIRLTYALKISKDCPEVFRVMALLFSLSITLYGVVELCSLIFINT
ncbi:hypothetical protein [Shewanella putrefaciens]|uniref:Uncharacterized protein n=1 Tax=Shewanella putrefaciens TaxID=24 RepID=A0ABX8XE93_SHEPU|nr:hypothetical protein [Shewanella putrefaciens]MCT8943469.1 hypothetical protein [Shewanella putrefaciens]QSE50052.1 hypothetical protein JW975_03290 [Shewanella putrefaciens]QYX73462.1 hypothetical protein K3G22_03290 [Shewanella putrefaciens]GGN20536.1 hypothetical protein GCM10007984_20080 [Shewanella putrefaciens]